MNAPTKGASREHILSRPHASSTESIAHALVTKSGELYFLCSPDGWIEIGRHHGLGLYCRDCRFLDGYEVDVAGRRLEVLAASDEVEGATVLALANPDLRVDGFVVPRASIGVSWRRALDPERGLLLDTLSFRNHGDRDLDLPIDLRFSARFEDVFRVRGLTRARPGRRLAPAWDGKVLRFVYDGADGVRRTLAIRTWPAPAGRQHDGAHIHLKVPAGEQAVLQVALAVGFGPEDPALGDEPPPEAGPPPAYTHPLTRFSCDSPLMDRIVARAHRDLLELRTFRDGAGFVAAGAPWFVALFGRDSLISGWQTLAWAPDVAAGVLRLLARHQARDVDPWRGAEPGKILHELRVGELAGAGEIPQTPYYGSVDATPLFLVVLDAYTRWSGDLSVFDDVRDAAEAALAWVLSYLDGPHGWLTYAGRSEDGLVNQGWKDSGNAMVRADGSLAEPPIAVVEAQGYAVAALRAMASLLARVGDEARAARLVSRAAALARDLDRAFWDPELGLHAMALEQGGRPCRVASSNPGHLLWTGAVSHARARAVADRLLAPDLYSGWGVRTLSSREKAYNPLGYHLGTVWPHDNAVLAAGLRRYGLRGHVIRVVNGILDAASRNPGYRLPELMSGLPPGELDRPVPYPAACHPQAWGAGSVLSLIHSALGLVGDGATATVEVTSPFLPGAIEHLELRGMRLGRWHADLAFDRHRSGAVRVEASGDVRVIRRR